MFLSLKKTHRLNVERLEDRCVLSATWGETALLTTTVGTVEVVSVQPGQTLQQLRALYPDAVHIEPDLPVQIDLTPNDPGYNSLYGMRIIDAPAAWDTSTGSAAMSVAVIDTGIDYTHPDLYLNIWINQREIPPHIRANLIDINGDGLITFHDLNDPRNQGPGKITDLNGNGRIDAGDILRPLSQGGWATGTDTAGNGYIDDLVGWNFVNNTNNPFDDNGHGTHVAGTIGAIGNNGRGVVGVNWEVQMAALKFLSASGSGSTSGAIAALNYAVNNGIPISNNSWGGGGFSSALATSINNARTNGHIFVAAAGNNGSNNDTTAYFPANYNFDNVVAVASTTSQDRLSNFSNFGANRVHLAAPGSGILSTTPNNTYSTFNGTSMATPHVAGAMALVWSQDRTQTYSEVIRRILDNVDVLSSLEGRVITGGRLNVARAMIATPSDTTGPRIISAVPNSATRPDRVRLTFSEPIDPTSFTLADITGFVGPNGVTVTPLSVVVVPGMDNTAFDVTFAPPHVGGTYRFDVGPDITDLAGNRMDQNQNGINGEADDSFRVLFEVSGVTTTTFTNSTRLAIRDFSTTVSTITIGANIAISDIDVRVNISHTYVSDLYIWLRGPDGTDVVLSAYRGGNGRHYSNTVFDDQAGGDIRNGVAPFRGSFRPEQSLSVFNDRSAQGVWRLFVYDGARWDTGTLNSWSLIVTGTPLGPQSAAMPADSDSDSAPLATTATRDAVFASWTREQDSPAPFGEGPAAPATATIPVADRIGSGPSREMTWSGAARAARQRVADAFWSFGE